MTFKDYFSEGSRSYRDYRPRYPGPLFEFLANTATHNELAWDCATGSGQSAVMLAPHFQRVVATDASANQVSQADRRDNIEYRVEPAERTGFRDNTVDLVTVSQALHWFELSRFEKEVSRVLKPGGVLAVWCYGIFSSTPEIDAVVESLYNGILGEYWTDERRVVEAGYQDVRFGFDELPSESFAMAADWSIDHLLGYLSTWSAGKRYQQQHGQNPLDLVVDELRAAWGTREKQILQWPLSLRLWQVPNG